MSLWHAQNHAKISNWFVEIDIWALGNLCPFDRKYMTRKATICKLWLALPNMCEARCCSWGKTIICWASHCGQVVGQQISLHQIDPNDCYILAGLLAVYSNNQHCCYNAQNDGSIWQELGNFLNWYHPPSPSLQLVVIKPLLSWWLTQFCPKFSPQQPDPQGETQPFCFYFESLFKAPQLVGSPMKHAEWGLFCRSNHTLKDGGAHIWTELFNLLLCRWMQFIFVKGTLIIKQSSWDPPI